MKAHIFLLSFCLLPLTACASITKGSNQKVSFLSEPVGASVNVYDILQDYDGGDCETPCELKLDRRGVYRATFTKDGYHSKKVKLVPEYSTSGLAGGAGSAVLGAGIGVGIDALTGAMKDPQPDPVSVKLVKMKTEDLTP